MQQGSWDRECGRNLRLYQVDEIKLKRWYIVYPTQMERNVNRFVNRATELARNMGFEISKPRTYVWSILMLIICSSNLIT